jgi:quinol-cytochrome oxidoreductase complex cytochrome b subunit
MSEMQKQEEEKKPNWFEERSGLKERLDAFLYRKVPRGVGWPYTLGSAAMVCFVLLTLTGIFLMMNYSPSPSHAYESVEYIMEEVPFGALIRGVHFWSASFMFVLVVLHGMRVFFMGAYKYPRELTWLVGIPLFLLVMGASFTGYLLPWDQKAFWATNIGAGMASQVPVIGESVKQVMIGGPEIGAVTLTRFFTFHVGVIAPLIAILIVVHIMLVVRHGISGPAANYDERPEA